MGIRTKLSSMGLTNRKKPFTDVMKYTVSVSDNGYVNLPVSQTTYTPDTVIKIDWGDGSTKQLEQGVAVSKNNIHQYTTAGEYQISISTRSNKLTNLSFYDDKTIISMDSPILNVGRYSSLERMFSYSTLTSFCVDLFALNSTRTTILGSFDNCNITTIPRGFTAYLPELNELQLLFTRCPITDIIQATNFLVDLKQYNKKVDEISGGIFENCPFTTDINIQYAQAHYNINGNLSGLCERWLINYIPYDIINQFDSNTSLQSMFLYGALSGSIQLQEIPLSVTDVGRMFDSTDITNVSGTFGSNCNVLNFSSIFSYCSDLVTIQDDFIPLSKPISRVSSMFKNTVENIPSTLFKGKNFTRCNLQSCITHPKLAVSNAFENSSFSKDTRFSMMFSSIPSGVKIPNKFFQGCIVDPSDYLVLSGIFDYYDSDIPEDIFDYFDCPLNLTQVFSFYLGVNDNIPDSIFNNLKIRSCSYLFGQSHVSSRVTQLPSRMFQGCIFTSDIISFDFTFRDNNVLTQVPQDLFDGVVNNGKTYSFDSCFRNCSGITSAVPELWNRTDMNIVSHTACFRGCTNAANYNDIPDDWK